MKEDKEALEREIEETVAALPQEIPEGAIETMKSRGALSHEILLYKQDSCFDPLEGRRRKMIWTHCTACGAESYQEQIRGTQECCHAAYMTSRIGFYYPGTEEEIYSGTTTTCPECGKAVTARHAGEFRSSYYIDGAFCLTVHNVRGHLALLLWQISRYLDKSGSVYCGADRWEGMLLVKRKPVRVSGFIRYMTAVTMLPRWTAKKRFSDEIGVITADSVIPYAKGLPDETDSANCIFPKYMHDAKNPKPASYLQTWAKWPQTENLVRQGFTAYLEGSMENCMNRTTYYVDNYSYRIQDTKNYINWKESKPHRMIGLRKEDLWIAKRYGVDIVRKYKELLQEGVKLEKPQLDTLKRFGAYSIHDLTKEPFHGYRVPVVRMLNYLEKQTGGGKKSANGEGRISPAYLRDYWAMVCRIYGRMEPGMLWPKDLIRSHDNLVMKIKEKEEAEITAKIAELSKEQEKLSWQDDETGLLIRPARSQGELIKEGKILQHCVATYAKAVARGETTIMFIRRQEDPEQPFFTLEWKKGIVIQNRGFKNRVRTPEVIAFEAKWIDHIKEMQKGEKHGLRGDYEPAGAAGT